MPEKQGTLSFVPMSSAKRALIAIAALAGIAAIGAAVLLYRWHRPLPGASGGPMPDLLSHLPADAPVVAYIDVAALKRLQGSPLAAILGLAGENPREDRDYQDFVRDTDFDYTRDLDRAAVALWPAKHSSQNVTFAVADGRFDEMKIKAYVWNPVTIVGPSESPHLLGEKRAAVKFLSPTRIEIATGPDADKLVSAPNSAPRNAAMQERINRVAGAPIFAVARTDNLPASFYDGLRSAPQFENVARSVQGLMLAGQPDGELIHVTLDAECDSMTNAVELATVVDSLRLLGSMALADPKARGQMTKQQAALLIAVLNQAKLTHQDRIVRLTLDVTPEMLGQSTSGPNAQSRRFDAAYAVNDLR
ncbi:MAG TPA: hypothetical protein VEJ46_04030 [Candidatus Acidoferrum sp.]|nr:hypothetical protein [Candidatus Acidoferrum sp.]